MLLDNTVMVKGRVQSRRAPAGATTATPGRSRTGVTGRPPALRKRTVTQERVLDAAERLFVDRGYRATSVQDIAAAAGYTTGAIYSSFSGKDELFVAVFERRIGRQEQVWRDALQSVHGIEDAALSMGAALTRAMPEPAWYAVMFEFFSYAGRDKRLRHATAATYRRPNLMLQDVLREVAVASPLPLSRLA